MAHIATQAPPSRRAAAWARGQACGPQEGRWSRRSGEAGASREGLGLAPGLRPPPPQSSADRWPRPGGGDVCRGVA